MAKYKDWLTEDGLLLLRKWARNGLTDEEIAENMGVAYSTLKEWKKKYPDISAAIKKTKDIYDSEVEEALEKAALGYYVYEETWKNKWNAKIKEFELVLDQRKKVWVKPDTTAQIFWLKNRDKLRWRDRQEVQMDIEENETGVIALPAIMEPEDPPVQPKGDKDDED